MAQERINPQRRDGDPADDTPPPAPVAPAVQTGEIDSVLDEIDSVLEANSEEFVRGFVQKGGQ